MFNTCVVGKRYYVYFTAENFYKNNSRTYILWIKPDNFFTLVRRANLKEAILDLLHDNDLLDTSLFNI